MIKLSSLINLDSLPYHFFIYLPNTLFQVKAIISVNHSSCKHAFSLQGQVHTQQLHIFDYSSFLVQLFISLGVLNCLHFFLKFSNILTIIILIFFKKLIIIGILSRPIIPKGITWAVYPIGLLRSCHSGGYLLSSLTGITYCFINSVSIFHLNLVPHFVGAHPQIILKK